MYCYNSLLICLCVSSLFISYIHHPYQITPQDLLKAQFISKILTPGASYTMIFGGSSVTAGHDNRFGQDYPHIIETVSRG